MQISKASSRASKYDLGELSLCTIGAGVRGQLVGEKKVLRFFISKRCQD